MKKRIRGLLVAGVVLCGIGVGMFALGAALGGNDYVGAADLNKMDGNARLDDGVVLEKTKLEEFDAIDATIRDADFRILPSGDQSCYLSYHIRNARVKEPVTYEVKDGTLRLTESNTSQSVIQIGVDINFIAYLLGDREQLLSRDEVVLYVPEGRMLEELQAAVDDGNVELEDVCAGRAELELGYGNLSLTDCSLDQGEIRISDGNMEVSRFSGGDMEWRLSYGSLELDTAKLKDCTVALSDGRMEAEALTLSGDNVIENAYGDVSLQLEKECREALAMELRTEYGALEIPAEWSEGSMTRLEEAEEYLRTPKSAQGSLKVTLKDGDLTMN